MRKRMILTALAAVAIPTLLMAADEARLMRFPATNGSEIVFSYAGDLYKVPATGGEAQRLTSYVGYEMFPRFSPDGKTIAFTGQYDGNTEVYTMPAVSHCVSLTRLRIAVMIWAIAWARTIS
jgi:tricorn protease